MHKRAPVEDTQALFSMRDTIIACKPKINLNAMFSQTFAVSTYEVHVKRERVNEVCSSARGIIFSFVYLNLIKASSGYE